MPQVRLSDPDLMDSVSAVDAAIRERHHAAPVAPPLPKAVRAARKSVWNPKPAILGVLWRPMIAPDLSKFTGIAIGSVCAALLEMEGKTVRKSGGQAPGWDGNLYDLWERIIAT
jgi:hypothetical protein